MLAANLPLLPSLLQLPVALSMDLLLTASEHRPLTVAEMGAFNIPGLQRFYIRTIGRINRRARLERKLRDAEFPDEDEMDEFARLDTDHWVKRGLKVHLIFQDVALTEGETHFRMGRYGRYVAWDVLRKFKQRVEDAEYERDHRRREGSADGANGSIRVANMKRL